MRNTLLVLIVLAIATSFMASAQIIDTGSEYISPLAMSQRALYNYLVRQRHQDYNKVMTSGSLNPTGTEIQIKSDVHYLMDGLFYRLVATDTPGFTASAQASGSKRIYLLSVNASGVATCTPGTTVSAIGTPPIPDVPSDHIPFGHLDVLANAPFTLGTTNFTSATSITSNISRLNPLGDENFQGL